MAKKSFVEKAYTTRRGRFLLNLMMRTGMLKVASLFVRSPLSKPMITKFVKKNAIDMTPFGDRKYKSFAEFFIRRKQTSFDAEPGHLISPCDGCLSVYEIRPDSLFTVKGRDYAVSDLLTDEKTAARFEGGTCLVFRLRETDYHRFCFIDDGFQGANHFVKGMLHSVQPIALEKQPVYSKKIRK